MSDNIIGCPFCGAKHTVETIRFGNHRQTVWCQNCHSRGPSKLSAAEAITAWNDVAEVYHWHTDPALIEQQEVRRE